MEVKGMGPDFDDVLGRWEKVFIAFFEQGRAEGKLEDASHDISHFQRVWFTAQKIIQKTNCHVDSLVVLAACYFHDVIVLPKNHPERSIASILAASETERCLSKLGFPDALIPQVSHAVKTHSYSAGLTPETIEAEIVQDADRMEALGAIGLARVFYTAGKLGQALFDPNDPLAQSRALDDRKYALDHFELKLLRIADTMKTPAGRVLAKAHSQYLQDFRQQLCEEIEGA